jgi:hypothetical protein
MSQSPRKAEAGGTRFSWLRHNVLGIVAIFLALSGTAVASQIASNGDAHSAKKKKVKRGPAGPQGPQGAPGAPGSALAFAHVAANGNLDAANSKNVSASSESGQDGYYCVTPSVPVKNFVVSVDESGGGANFGAMASFTDHLTACSAGQVVVTTYTVSNSVTLTSKPFYILFN